ncbi:hypothetical protein PVE_R1G2023 [Pseudomonas veronii 1YdBTEX2]|uniref:Uncharacterized protein n=1 Tax=Pseudomonas veronii 1YdBTEX2 TaxID=1295141 RepID=A0A1D3JUX4_PSEVE|nr:hypothetical protein [Pseudomonas veronii]SBW79909.1 hypothetical protein PVE_R1G2023 [Pseudomonas veronii 1YdBTEX2]
MPRVPTYDTAQVQQQPTRPIQLQRVAPDTTSIAQGLQTLGRGAQMLMDKEREKADTALLMDADNQLTKWQQQSMYGENGAYTRKGQNALDVTNQTLDQFEKAQAEIAKTLTNDQQKARYAQIVNSRRNSLSSDLNRYEYGERQNYYGQVEKAQLETSMQGAALEYQDPAKVDQYRQKVDAVLTSRAQRLGLSPEAAQAERLETNSGMSSAVIQRMLIDSPQKAKSYYESYKDTMTAEDQIRTSNGIDQGFRRLEAEARQRQVEARQMQAINRMELSSRVQDASAAYSQGLDFDNPPSKVDFAAAYGPEKGAKEYDRFSKVQALAPAIREFATADPKERQAILGKFQPAQDGTAGEGFKEDSQLYQHLTNVGVRLMKQQQDDPAAYVVKYSPTVQQAFAAAQQDGTPEAYQAYARTTLAEQQRLGVTQPKLLPDAAADQMAANFNTKVSGGENAATMIEQQQELWGKDFPTVLQQMGNKLPAEAQVIATGLPKDVAERMASVAAIKDSDLNAGLQKGQKDDIVQSVQQALVPFAESLQGQSGGINTYSTMYKAALRTATSYVLQGENPKDAAKRVVGGMVNDKYDFFGTYRVPKTQDTEAVSRGATQAMRQIKPEELMPLPGFAGVTEEQNRKQLHDALQSSGQWVPNEDETGLSLTLNGYRVRGADGKPITRSWADLQQKGLREPDQYRVAPMGFMP